MPQQITRQGLETNRGIEIGYLIRGGRNVMRRRFVWRDSSRSTLPSDLPGYLYSEDQARFVIESDRRIEGLMLLPKRRWYLRDGDIIGLGIDAGDPQHGDPATYFRPYQVKLN